MTLLTLELPDAIAAALGPDAPAAAREAVIVDLYRRRKLTHHQLATTLGLDRFATDALLKSHGVFIEMTPADFADELADVRDLATR